MAAELHEPLLSRVLRELADQEERGAAPPDSFDRLGDDLLVAVLSRLSSAQLRTVAGVCRRWASLVRSHGELWTSTEFALPPRQSRGRDRCATECN